MKKRLKRLLENSHSPFYQFKVAAIVECRDGKTFEGVNVETTSPASGICAERNALYSAITAGYKKGDIKTIYIMNNGEKPCFPCFVCRQALIDFCDKDVQIISYSCDGAAESLVKLEELCSYSFDIKDLNVN